MKKRLFSLFTAFIIGMSLVAVVPTMAVGAETSGDFEYKILYDGTIEIIDYNGSATNLTIPSTIDGKQVTIIGSWAFQYCLSLTNITIPNSVTSIEFGAFYCCSSITNISMSNSLIFIEENVFNGCSSLTDIIIPDSVISVEDLAFANCSNLTNVTIGNSVTGIGDLTFAGCLSLSNIIIPDNVTSIGYEAFWGCSLLTNITVDYKNINYSSADGVLFNKNKTKLIQYPIGNLRNSYSLPNSVKSIEDGAFARCSNLINVTIGNQVTGIGEYAFYNCSSLVNVYYTGSKNEWDKVLIHSSNKNLINANIHFKEHIHSYTSKITKQPTCTATGIKTFTCSCGDSYTETITKTGHSYSTKVIVPTCTSQGYTLHT